VSESASVPQSTLARVSSGQWKYRELGSAVPFVVALATLATALFQGWAFIVSHAWALLLPVLVAVPVYEYFQGERMTLYVNIALPASESAYVRRTVACAALVLVSVSCLAYVIYAAA
jgi:hypothetical protein